MQAANLALAACLLALIVGPMVLELQLTKQVLTGCDRPTGALHLSHLAIQPSDPPAAGAQHERGQEVDYIEWFRG